MQHTCPRPDPRRIYSATADGEEEARHLGARDWLTKGKTTWDDLLRRIVDVCRARQKSAH
jgi:hypothetical protein